jgi:hypothetical protein
VGVGKDLSVGLVELVSATSAGSAIAVLRSTRKSNMEWRMTQGSGFLTLEGNNRSLILADGEAERIFLAKPINRGGRGFRIIGDRWHGFPSLYGNQQDPKTGINPFL